MNIVEECASAVREITPCTRLMSLHAAKATLAEFARLAQSPEMVERLTDCVEMLSPTAGSDWLPGEARRLVKSFLVAMFREAGVSGGGR